MKPVVLIVEDSRLIQDLYMDAFSNNAELLQAYTQEEARRYFAKNNQINCIVVDGNVPESSGHASNPTTELIRYFRSLGYDRPIIASAGDPVDEIAMMDAGCDEFHTKNERGLLASLKQAINDAS